MRSMDTSVSVTAELFTKGVLCKELVESEPKMAQVIASRIIVPERRNVQSAIVDARTESLISLGLRQSGTW